MSCAAYKSLLYWEDPVRSAVVFVPVALLLISLSIWSMVSVLAWSFLTLLFSVGALKGFGILMDKLGKPNPLGNPLEPIQKADVSVSKETVQQGVGVLVNQINLISSKLKKIILVEDVIETVKFGSLCYTLTFIGSWFNALTLVLIGWVFTFVLPKLYINNQVVVDDVVSKVNVQVDAIKAKIYKKDAVTSPKKEE